MIELIRYGRYSIPVLTLDHHKERHRQDVNVILVSQGDSVGEGATLRVARRRRLLQNFATSVERVIRSDRRKLPKLVHTAPAYGRDITEESLYGETHTERSGMETTGDEAIPGFGLFRVDVVGLRVKLLPELDQSGSRNRDRTKVMRLTDGQIREESSIHMRVSFRGRKYIHNFNVVLADTDGPCFNRRTIVSGSTTTLRARTGDERRKSWANTWESRRNR